MPVALFQKTEVDQCYSTNSRFSFLMFLFVIVVLEIFDIIFVLVSIIFILGRSLGKHLLGLFTLSANKTRSSTNLEEKERHC